MTEEIKRKYFAETAIALRREGFQVEQLQDGHLNVMMDDQPLCEVNKIGGITYRDVSTPERIAAKDKAFGIVSTTAEYIRGMELAPPLGVKDLKDRFRVVTICSISSSLNLYLDAISHHPNPIYHTFNNN